MPVRPQLADVQLAPVKAITYPGRRRHDDPRLSDAAAGQRRRRICPRSSCRMAARPRATNGASTGCPILRQPRLMRCIQPEFRGSTGYGDAWFNKNGYQSWRTAIGDVNDAGRWLVKQGIADPTKLAIVGWSYGGYAALQSSVLDPTCSRRSSRSRRSPISKRCSDEYRAVRPTTRCSTRLIGQARTSPGRLAGAQRRQDQGAGAAVPRRRDQNVGDRRVAPDGSRRLQGAGKQGRTGRVQGARPPARRQRPRGRRCSAKADAFLRASMRNDALGPERKRAAPQDRPFYSTAARIRISASRTRRPGSAPSSPDRALRRASARG